jgi:hypothetical protein
MGGKRGKYCREKTQTRDFLNPVGNRQRIRSRRRLEDDIKVDL